MDIEIKLSPVALHWEASTDWNGGYVQRALTAHGALYGLSAQIEATSKEAISDE